MGLRRFVLVAGQAVCGDGCVVNFNVRPFFHIGMAEGAGAWQMRLRCVLVVAAFALGHALVLVGDLRPLFCVGMAFIAGAWVVKRGCVWAVARFAGAGIVVRVAVEAPVGGVCVAQLAVAGVMDGGNGRYRIVDKNDVGQCRQGQIFDVARRAFGDPGVVKLRKLPAGGGVACFTASGKMVRIHLPQIVGRGEKQVGWRSGGWQGVAVGAACWRVGVLPIGMAADARQVGVPSRQGEGGMVDVAYQERYERGRI